jgi:hypothetical protein
LGSASTDGLVKITVNSPNDMAKTPSLRLSKDLDPQALVITRVSRVALDASGFMGVFAMKESATLSLRS